MRFPHYSNLALKKIIGISRYDLWFRPRDFTTRSEDFHDRYTVVTDVCFRCTQGNYREGNFREGNYREGNYREGNYREGNTENYFSSEKVSFHKKSDINADTNKSDINAGKDAGSYWMTGEMFSNFGKFQTPAELLRRLINQKLNRDHLHASEETVRGIFVINHELNGAHVYASEETVSVGILFAVIFAVTGITVKACNIS
jgi:hypothetical protein